jgi:hypothetical protein
LLAFFKSCRDAGRKPGSTFRGIASVASMWLTRLKSARIADR